MRFECQMCALHESKALPCWFVIREEWNKAASKTVFGASIAPTSMPLKKTAVSCGWTSKRDYRSYGQASCSPARLHESIVAAVFELHGGAAPCAHALGTLRGPNWGLFLYQRVPH